ncbi:MAG: 50S ribosomal protein L17 [Tissierellia bacterium]|nr:50S ribosomal protein L17 [Tissierellia bacterium]
MALRKLGRKTDHRMAMLRNMTTSLLLHGRLATTVTRAKEVRRMADKMITLGKRGDLHAKRQVASVLYDKEAGKKVFTEYAEKYADRNGGYTRILKTGVRRGDASEMCIIELV